jgi:hypothetical protein
VKSIAAVLILGAVFFPAVGFCTVLNLSSSGNVQSGGSDISVTGYSTPSYVDWNNDGKLDLLVGEGGGVYSVGKVRVYLNVGTASNPEFSGY